MNKEKKIEHEIEKTLGMFERKDSIPSNPYFYTRVKQRIDEKSNKEFSVFGVLKPAFFTLLVVLNLTTAIWYTSSIDSTTGTETDSELVDILKSDFNLDSDNNESLIFE